MRAALLAATLATLLLTAMAALTRLLLLLARLLAATTLLAAARLTALLLLTGTLRILLVGILVRHTCHSLRKFAPSHVNILLSRRFRWNPNSRGLNWNSEPARTARHYA